MVKVIYKRLAILFTALYTAVPIIVVGREMPYNI